MAVEVSFSHPMVAININIVFLLPSRDAIFVEGIRFVLIGWVLKVDGDFAAVKFPPQLLAGAGSSSGNGIAEEEEVFETVEAIARTSLTIRSRRAVCCGRTICK